MDDEEPEIIARGEWLQEANGDITYFPAHVRPRRLVGYPHPGWQDHAPQYDPLTASEDEEEAVTRDVVTRDSSAPPPHDSRVTHHDSTPDPTDRAGYRIRSDAVWARARADYLAGDPATAVCDRHDLNLKTFKSRAAREGWRRVDQPDPEPLDLDTEPPVEPGDVKALADQALIRARRAIGRGAAMEAGRWLRVHAQLTRLIVAEPAPPDPATLIAIKMRAVADIARAAAGMDPDNEHGQAAIGALLDDLDGLPVTTPDALAATSPVSYDSDHSDPVSPPDDTGAVSSDPPAETGDAEAIRPPAPCPRPPLDAPPEASRPPDEARASLPS